SILADDSSTITATASSFTFDFDWLPVTASLHLSTSTAINVVNKEIEASVSNATVTAAGAIVVQAMNSMHVIGSAQTESLVPTGALTMASVSFGGTYVSNNLLGSISALVTDSTLTTTAAGDVTVRAGDNSVADARAQAGTSTGSSVAGAGGQGAALAGALAMNTIGWVVPNPLAAATLDTLLGTSFFQSEQPSRVQAKVVHSKIDAAGAAWGRGGGQGRVRAAAPDGGTTAAAPRPC